MYIKNNNSPKTESCGTPIIGSILELVLLLLTYVYIDTYLSTRFFDKVIPLEPYIYI